MSENFELLETGQIEIMHQQVHDRQGADGETDCDTIRVQHDSLAAELVKRGMPHDTEIICPESALGQRAPNYRRGFTDDVCTQCAFGQLFSFCNLYKEEYVRGYTCDSFRYFEVIELEPPHGFLMASGKQTAIASDNTLDYTKPYLIVSNGEVFGITELEQAAQVKTKEFDNDEWLGQHRVTPRERRQWWADTEVFYVHRIKNWYPYEGIKLYEDGKVVDEPKLTAKQWQIVSTAKELPKQITLLNDAVSVTDRQEFIIDLSAKCSELDSILSATYQTNVKEAKRAKESISLYSLALVRNPRMRVSKKKLETEEKQEGEGMPFRIRKRGDEYCVVKVNPDDSDGDVSGCHDTREGAEDQLTALNINVTAEEGESAIYTDKPRKRKPRKKKENTIAFEKSSEKPKKAGFMDNLRSLSKSIADFLKSAEKEELLFVGDVGIGQKLVNGELWHLTWSTNAFEDREKEIFSTKSLESYVLQAEKSQDKGFFNLWHIEGTDFARKEWQGVVGRFLVEAGPYLDDKRGLAAKEFFSEYGNGHSELAPEGWGCSPEFRYLPEERATGVYENIWITRTSTLPKMAAANIWTKTRQLARSKMALSEDQIKAAIEVFKDEDFVKSLITEGESKTAELESAGVAHKDNEPEPQEVKLNMEELAKQVGEQFQADLTPIAEAITAMVSSQKDMESRLDELEKSKHVKEKTETPRFIFNMQRASEQEETIVTDDDGLKNKKPNETQAGNGDAWSQIFNK